MLTAAEKWAQLAALCLAIEQEKETERLRRQRVEEQAEEERVAMLELERLEEEEKQRRAEEEAEALWKAEEERQKAEEEQRKADEEERKRVEVERVAEEQRTTADAEMEGGEGSKETDMVTGVTEGTGDTREQEMARLQAAVEASSSKDGGEEYWATEGTCWSCQHRKLVCEQCLLFFFY